jgi:predicted phage baseplate assembly protein
VSLPLENLDDRTFEQLFAAARARIPLYLPEWTDWNESDPGIAILQLQSWLAETILWRVNRLPDKRLYRAFLNLLGIERGDAVPASASVAFDVEPGSPPQTLAPDELTVSAPGTDGNEVFFEPVASLPLVGASLSALLVDDRARRIWLDVLGSSQDVNATFAPFGETQARDAALYLGLDTSRDGAANRLVAPFAKPVLQILVSRDPGDAQAEPQSTAYAHVPASTVSNVAWEGWNGAWIPLEAIDETAALTRSGIVRLTLDESLAPVTLTGDPKPRDRYWLRARALRVPDGGVRLRFVEINATVVGQWTTYDGEPLGSGSSGLAGQRIDVQHPPILASDDVPLTVFVAGEEGDPFVRVGELPAADQDPKRIVAVENDTTVVFGDGRNAVIPTRGLNNLRVRYRSGGGARGNGKSDVSLTRSPLGVNAVRVVERSDGGRDAESVDSVETEAGKRARANERAVTARDFEDLARAKAGVARAIALTRVDPRFPGADATGALTLVAIPPARAPGEAPPPATDAFLRAVSSELEKYRVLTTELFVIAARYRTVGVQARLTAPRGTNLIELKANLVARVREYLDPLRGGPNRDGWPIGRPVGYGEMLGVLASVSSSAIVVSLELTLDGQPVAPLADAAIGPHELVGAEIPRIEVEEARSP